MKPENRWLPWILLVGFGWLAWLLAPILTPFIASALLAYMGDPLVDRLEKLKLSRTLAVLVVFIGIFTAILLVVLLLVPLFRQQIGALVTKLPDYVAFVEARVLPRIIEWLGISEGGDQLGIGALMERYGSEMGQLGRTALSTVSRSGTALLGVLVSMFLIPVITFYLLRDWDILVARFAALVPEETRPRAVELAVQTDRALGGFLRGQLMVMLSLAFIYSVGLAIVGLDFALAIGVVAGLVSFVPYLGLIVGIALAGVAALVQLQSLLAVAGVVAVFVVGQMVEGTLLTPKLVGDRIGLHPVLVIFAVMAGGQLFGFFGVLIGLPAAAVVSVMARFAYGHYLQSRTGAPVPVAPEPAVDTAVADSVPAVPAATDPAPGDDAPEDANA